MVRSATAIVAAAMPAFIEAGRELVRLGADGLTTGCGFLSVYQRELATALDVPVATSSLMQIPLIERMLPDGVRVGILTVSAETLTADHLTGAGVDPSTPVAGTEAGKEFSRVLLNDVTACAGEGLDARACLDAIRPTSRADIPFTTALSPTGD